MLVDKTVKDFSEMVAGVNPPVPAAGSTIALNGLLGISLLILALKVSSKDSRSNLNQAELSPYLCLLSEGKELFQESIELDVISFQQNQATDFKDRENLKELNKTPLQIAIKAVEILEMANLLAGEIKKTVKADFQIGLSNLTTALEGAVIIIESNLQIFKDHFVEDPEYLQETETKLREIKDWTKKINRP